MEDKESVVIVIAGKRASQRRRNGMNNLATNFLSHYEVGVGDEDDEPEQPVPGDLPTNISN